LIIALARRGKTVILSSHLLSDVEDVCDRVVIYYGGRIQASGALKELLAKPDHLLITTPVLPRQTIERVLEIIRSDAASGEVRVDNPTQNLESYFLDVVAKARAENETSGAQSGARVAEYLRGGLDARTQGERVLDKLALPQAAAAPAKNIVESAASKVDDSKLAALARPTAPVRPTEKAGPETAAPKPEDLAKADEKLSSLLGGKK
jgi:ABC-2 type transport system ATP-binding protein